MSRNLGSALLVAISLGLSRPCGAAGAGPASAFPPASTNCTEAASKAASWEIRNFTFDTDTRYYYGPGTAGKVSFSIKNSANGYEFNCLQGNGQTARTPNHFLDDGKVWYSCNVYCQGSQFFGGEDNPALNTTFHFDVDSKELRINQAWTCGDGKSNNTKQTIFNGRGSSTVSNTSCSPIPNLRQDEVACTPADVTVKATNVSTGIPIVLEDLDEVDSGVYTNPPRNGQAATKPKIQHNTTGCTQRSHSPSWTVTSFYPTVYGAGFTVTNNALNYTARCDLQDYSLNGADKPANKMARSSWWNCSRNDDSHATYPYYDGVYTQVLIGGPQNLLGINQTWYCDDEDPTSPTIFSAYAESKYRTDCNHTRACYNVQYQAQPVLQSEDRCSVRDMALKAAHVNEVKVSRDKAHAMR